MVSLSEGITPTSPWRGAPPTWDLAVYPMRIGREETEEREWVLEGPFGVDHWGQKFCFPQGVRVHARCRWEKDSFEVALRVEGTGEVSCARCLVPTPLAIRGDFVYFFLLRRKGEEFPGEDEEAEEHLVELERWPEKLSLAAYAWETLVAEIPSRVLCAEGCLGLCSRCGVNRNQESCSCEPAGGDLRFLKLKERPMDR